MKHLIFDAGPIISLSMCGMINVLERLSENFDGEFIITPQVKREVVDRPMKIKKFELEAFGVKNLIDKGVLKLSSEFISDGKLSSETKRILKISNSAIRSKSSGEKIKMIHEGEASCIAFSNLCKCDNMIVVDERTTRLMSEAPENLKEYMQGKLHTPLEIDMSLLKEFRKDRFIRSSELLFIAYKKDLLPMKKEKQLLDALLYGVKFKGTAITVDEIEEMKRMV